jgi:hypothetical protein
MGKYKQKSFFSQYVLGFETILSNTKEEKSSFFIFHSSDLMVNLRQYQKKKCFEPIV